MASKKRAKVSQHEAKAEAKAEKASGLEREAGQASEVSDEVRVRKLDPVRVELMKRIYVARDPEATAETFLHHPDCDDKGGTEGPAKCEVLGCQAFSGTEVGVRIDAGWWNSVPGDH